MIRIPRNLSRGCQRARLCQRRFAGQEGVERAIDFVAGEFGAVRGRWLPRWVPSQPFATVRTATSDLLTMLPHGALTPSAIVRYAAKHFQEAIRLADGKAGQEKFLLNLSA